MAAQKIHSRMEHHHYRPKTRGGRTGRPALEVRYQVLSTRDSEVRPALKTIRSQDETSNSKSHSRRYSEFLEDFADGPRVGAIRCSVQYICFGACLVFVGSILLCAFGFTIVLPYRATLHWPQVTCNVTNSSYSGETCSCNQVMAESRNGDRYDDCTAKYPCLHVFVEYVDRTRQFPDRDELKGNNQEEVEAISRSAFLYRSWADSFYNECSLYECGDEQWNIKESRRFRLKWGQPGGTFPCFYDPENPSRVVVKRTSRSQMLHAILWPTLALTAGAIIWLGLCFGCCKIEQDSNNPPTYRTR